MGGASTESINVASQQSPRLAQVSVGTFPAVGDRVAASANSGALGALRPWEDGNRNRANALLRHLDFVIRGGNAAPVVPQMCDVDGERCLFADGRLRGRERRRLR